MKKLILAVILTANFSHFATMQACAAGSAGKTAAAKKNEEDNWEFGSKLEKMKKIYSRLSLAEKLHLYEWTKYFQLLMTLELAKKSSIYFPVLPTLNDDLTKNVGELEKFASEHPTMGKNASAIAILDIIQCKGVCFHTPQFFQEYYLFLASIIIKFKLYIEDDLIHQVNRASAEATSTSNLQMMSDTDK